MKVIRESIWEIIVNSKRIKNQNYWSARRCKLSDQLKVIGVIIEGRPIDESEYTIKIKELIK